MKVPPVASGALSIGTKSGLRAADSKTLPVDLSVRLMVLRLPPFQSNVLCISSLPMTRRPSWRVAYDVVGSSDMDADDADADGADERVVRGVAEWVASDNGAADKVAADRKAVIRGKIYSFRFIFNNYFSRLRSN